MRAREQILEAVKALPGVTTRELVELCPEVPSNSMSAHLSSLYAQGLLTRENGPVGGLGRPMFRWSFNPDPKPVVVKPAKRTTPTSAGLQARLDAALEKIAVLEKWKADAVARHPNLGVDPRVLEARQIVAKVFRDAHDTNNAAAVESGAKDGSPIMLATLAALGE